MKRRIDFVTNSSTTNFVLVNITNEKASLKDFLLENIELIRNYAKQIKEDGLYMGELLSEFELLDWIENESIGPYDVLIYDLSEASTDTEYILKNMNPGSGKSKRFIWKRERE
jgi:hypothetical protein